VRRLSAAVLVVLMGCGAPRPSVEPTPASTQLTAAASPTVEPTASPLSSISPSASPPATPAPTRDPDPCSYRAFDGPWNVAPLLLGSAVRVAVTELNLRAGPCTAAKKLGTLSKGTILIVNDQAYGPFKGNGLPWYLVAVAPNVGPPGELPPLPSSPFPDGTDSAVGWIAANDGSKPFVTAVPPRCPTKVDLENVMGMLPAERLACFESPIVLEGTFGCGGCGGSGGAIAKPVWLATTFEGNNLRTHWDLDQQPTSIYFRPRGPAQPREGSIIRVTVHVDDPAALKCSLYWAITDPPFTVPDEIAIPYCRERMVVESYRILGTDPDYPG
jgi:hypothetical protein